MYLHQTAANDHSELPAVSLPLNATLRAAIPAAALVTVSLLVDWRLMALITTLSLMAFAGRSVRSYLLAENELAGHVADALTIGWMSAAVLFLLGLPAFAIGIIAGVGVAYLVLASLSAQLFLAGMLGFLVGRNGGLGLLHFFDAVREAWTPRSRLLACSLGLVVATAETTALSVLLFAALQLEPAMSMAAALLLRTAIIGLSWASSLTATHAEDDVFELPAAPMPVTPLARAEAVDLSSPQWDVIDRDIAA